MAFASLGLLTGLIACTKLFECSVTGELAPPANPLICPQFW
jgi:hypothetical protein